jgi:diamine N-acetyltransferase
MKDESNGIMVILRELDQSNWQEAIALRVTEGQEAFAPSNLWHIAQARFYPEWVLLGIFVGKTMVGFTMYGAIEDGASQIMHLMLDAQHQGKGYGKAALDALLRRISEEPSRTGVWLSVHPENGVARRLYEQVGFRLRETGMEAEDEVFMYLALR